MFAAAAVVFVGLLTGLAPALQSGRGDLTTSLKSGAREGTYHGRALRVGAARVSGRVVRGAAVGAGLFVRSLNNVRSLRMGYDIEPLLWVVVEERDEKFSDAEKIALRSGCTKRRRRFPASQARRAR